MRRRAVVAGLTAISLVGLKRPVRAEMPVRLRFAELYEGDGITGLAYSAKTQELAGRRIAMRGYMAPPLKAEASFFVLTRNPVNLCPFCDSDADWPIDIVVVYPGDDAEFVQSSVPIEVVGKLELGGFTDPTAHFYSRLRLMQASFRALG